jgi:aspartate-semialdehyde dehydrogenase
LHKPASRTATPKKTAGTVSIIGGDSLLARELRDILAEQQPAPRVQLVTAAADNATSLVPEDEDAAVLLPLTKQSLEGSAIAYLAGTAASSRRTAKLGVQGMQLVDLTGALEATPGASLRAPSAEPDDKQADNKQLDYKASTVHVIAHPAAIALTMLLTRVAAAAPIRSTIAHIFEPASERGQRGIEELRKQTVGVLAFQKLDTAVYDTQLAFSMLARYGEEAVEPLEGVEARIERNLSTLLSAWAAMPMPSIRLLQAPVFHGHSISLWIEFESVVKPARLATILSAADIDVRPDEPPSNAGIAGLSGISVGAIHADRNQPRALWLWLVADNLRLVAENAVALTKGLA